MSLVSLDKIPFEIGDFETFGPFLKNHYQSGTMAKVIAEMPAGLMSFATFTQRSHYFWFIGQSAADEKFYGEEGQPFHFASSEKLRKFRENISAMTTIIRMGSKTGDRGYQFRREGVLCFDVRDQKPVAIFYLFPGGSSHDLLNAMEGIERELGDHIQVFPPEHVLTKKA